MKDWRNRKEIEVGGKCWIHDDSYVTTLEEGRVQSARLREWYAAPMDVVFTVVGLGGSYPTGGRDVAVGTVEANNVILWEPRDNTYWFAHNSRIVML